MTTKEAIDACIELLRVLTAWPLVLLAVLLFFRTEIRKFLPEVAGRLARRLTKAQIGGTSFEFSKEEADALRDTIEKGAANLSDQPQELADFVTEQVSKLVAPHQRSRSSKALDGRSILWVDDNPDNNTYETSLFRHLGAEVQLATSTAQALDILEQREFDLVITDVSRYEAGKRNGQAGYQLISKLETREPYIPTVIYTGNVSRLDRVASAPASGAADDPHSLRETVLNLIGVS